MIALERREREMNAWSSASGALIVAMRADLGLMETRDLTDRLTGGWTTFEQRSVIPTNSLEAVSRALLSYGVKELESPPAFGLGDEALAALRETYPGWRVKLNAVLIHLGDDLSAGISTTLDEAARLRLAVRLGNLVENGLRGEPFRDGVDGSRIFVLDDDAVSQ